jgi:hypothetical protein
VFNSTFNNSSIISWQSILLVEETIVCGENHRPVSSDRQTLSQNVVEYTIPWMGFKLTTLTNFITSCCIEHTWTRFELIMLVVIGTDCTGSCKSNYHTITTAPIFNEILFHWHYHDWTWLLCIQNWNLHNLGCFNVDTHAFSLLVL